MDEGSKIQTSLLKRSSFSILNQGEGGRKNKEKEGA